MAAITVSIPEEQLRILQQLAQDSQVTPEDLLSASIVDWLSGSQDEFNSATNYVLKKNAELYHRLA